MEEGGVADRGVNWGLEKGVFHLSPTVIYINGPPGGKPGNRPFQVLLGEGSGCLFQKDRVNWVGDCPAEAQAPVDALSAQPRGRAGAESTEQE